MREIARAPRLWGFALVPAIAALFVALLVAFLGYRGLHELFPSLFREESGLVGVGKFAVRIVAYVVLVFGSVFLGMALAQPLSGPALDRIARETRRASAARRGEAFVEPPPVSFLATTLRSLRVVAVTLLVGTPIVLLLTIIELVFPPAAVVTWPAKLIVTGILATWDLIDYPMSLEQRGVRARTAWLRENVGAAIGFGVTAALLSAIPFVGLFLLPCAVAGATLLVEDRREK